MSVKELAVDFLKGYYKEYFNLPENMIVSYGIWNKKMANGEYPKVRFHKKDPITYLLLKNTDLWLYEKDGHFEFKKLYCMPTGFDIERPLMLWVAYPKEYHFILYKTTGFGVTRKQFLIYLEHEGYIYMKWTDDISRATFFSFDSDD